MEIEVGQIWDRKRPEEKSDFFPQDGWAVEVLDVDNENVTFHIVEYDGRTASVRESQTKIQHPIAKFLKLYDLR